MFLTRLPLSDLDADGLDDAWEFNTFGDRSCDGLVDSDQDGFLDRCEYMAGTCPTDVNSTFRVSPLVEQAKGCVTIYWSAMPGKTYRVQYAASHLGHGEWWFCWTGRLKLRGAK